MTEHDCLHHLKILKLEVYVYDQRLQKYRPLKIFPILYMGIYDYIINYLRSYKSDISRNSCHAAMH